MRKTILAFVCFTIGLAGQETGRFDGTWVYRRADGQNVLKIEINSNGTGLVAVVTAPKKIAFNQDGSLMSSGTEFTTSSPMSTTRDGDTLKFADGPSMALTDASHATLTFAPQMKPLPLVRLSKGQNAEMAMPHTWPPAIETLRAELAALTQEDQEARKALDDARVKQADVRSETAVARILDRYGWVTTSLAGEDAAHNFFVLVQHDSDLKVQERALSAMKTAVDAGEASKLEYAYLFDRVQVRLGKPQHWGTQTSCSAQGPSPWQVDDESQLDAHRRELGLPPESEYLKSPDMVSFCSHAKGK